MIETLKMSFAQPPSGTFNQLKIFNIIFKLEINIQVREQRINLYSATDNTY